MCFLSESLSQIEYEIFQITSQFHSHFTEAEQGRESSFLVDGFQSFSELLFVATSHLFLLSGAVAISLMLLFVL